MGCTGFMNCPEWQCVGVLSGRVGRLARSFVGDPRHNPGSDRRPDPRLAAQPGMRRTRSCPPMRPGAKPRPPGWRYPSEMALPTWARPETAPVPPHSVTGRCPSIRHWHSAAASRSLVPVPVRAGRQQRPAQRQPLPAIAVSQKSILPNPYQPFGYDVQRQPAHEFHRLQRHLLAPATVGVVLPGEGDPIVPELDQTVIAQGDPVRVPSQVFQYLFRPPKGLLGIDHPVLLVQRPYRGRPRRRARQGQGAPSELELAGLVGGAQGCQVLAAEDLAQHSDRQEPVGPAGHPRAVPGRLGQSRCFRRTWRESPTRRRARHSEREDDVPASAPRCARP